MTTSSKITEIQVYWDTQDPANEGWAYRWRIDGEQQSAQLDGIADNDLDGAIAQACHEIDCDITPDQFAREPNVDGGHAIWSSAE